MGSEKSLKSIRSKNLEVHIPWILESDFASVDEFLAHLHGHPLFVVSNLVDVNFHFQQALESFSVLPFTKHSSDFLVLYSRFIAEKYSKLGDETKILDFNLSLCREFGDEEILFNVF